MVIHRGACSALQYNTRIKICFQYILKWSKWDSLTNSNLITGVSTIGSHFSPMTQLLRNDYNEHISSNNKIIQLMYSIFFVETMSLCFVVIMNVNYVNSSSSAWLKLPPDTSHKLFQFQILLVLPKTKYAVCVKYTKVYFYISRYRNS